MRRHSDDELPMVLRLSDVSVYYRGRRAPAVDRLSLEINQNEFVSLIGPTGCGKSTILSVLGGFRSPTQGTATCNGETIGEPGINRGIVLQDPTLFSWRTVARNISFGMEMVGCTAAEIQATVDTMLHAINLKGWESAYPYQLSGGMKQRVALARALATDPPILLLDEPFGALDAQTRSQMQALLMSLWEAKRKTVMFVTHDIEEAILLSNRVVLLSASPGRVIAEFNIDLPRPRMPQIVLSEPFLSIKRQIHEILREEIRRSTNRPDQASVGINEKRG